MVQVVNILDQLKTSGRCYNSSKPVPTNNNQLTNGAGYITGQTSMGKCKKSQGSC